MLSVNLSLGRTEQKMPLPQIRINYNPDTPKSEPVYQTGDVAKFVSFLKTADREILYALHLDAKLRIIAMELISVGSLTNSIIHQREIFKGAILNNSARIILVHNHPSGDATPSKDDLDITAKCMEAGGLLGIEVLDHVIVSANGHESIKKHFDTIGQEIEKTDEKKKGQEWEAANILVSLNETMKRQGNLSRPDIKKLSRKLRKAIYKLFLSQGIAKCALRKCYTMTTWSMKN
ncbi:MAG: JAB domain-containing protein [Nitrospirae bacterium]|nr:JAB domain-containing protein [Nitrospirota bacterium]MCL5978174.1 JAB domain-containing protein [Nitrospirota bacterium]